MLNPSHTLAAVALAASLCTPAQAVVLAPMLPAAGMYVFQGRCLDCQATGLDSSKAAATLEVDDVYSFSNWKFAYTSLLFPGSLTSTAVTGFSSDGVLSGKSAATVYFDTVTTAVPNSTQTSSHWVFGTYEDGDLYWDLSPQEQHNADFGNNGLWSGPTANTAVSEPGALALLAIALAGLRLTRRRV